VEYAKEWILTKGQTLMSVRIEGTDSTYFLREGGVKMIAKTKPQKKIIYDVEDTPDDFDFQLPNFSSPEKAQGSLRRKLLSEANMVLDSLPHEDSEVDERLTKRVAITMNFHQLMVDGFDYLAKLKGIGSGKNLMYMVLNQYLNENLPDEF